MPNAETARVTLHVSLDSEPIRGTLGDPDDGARDFCGYLELASALEAWRSEAAGVAVASSRNGTDVAGE
jgi:hypothetical protein